MNENIKKKWYQKKRFYIPLGIVAIFTIVSLTDESTSNTTQQKTQNTQTSDKQVKDTITIPPYQQPLNVIQEPPTTQSQPEKLPTQKPNPTPKSGCDPNYSGCVPIASDVDCAGGSGNGPAYVRGPVNVIGSDIYGLDRDGNGIGCE